MSKITKVIKMEFLEEELKELEKTCDLSSRKVGFFNKGNYLQSHNLKEFYTQEIIDLVLDKYAKDFDTFNYSKTIDF